MEANKSAVKKSFTELVNEKQGSGRNNQSIPMDLVQDLAEGAISDSVSAERLMGQEQYFHNVMPFLEADEQPHYLFPLTKGFFADIPLIIDSGAEREEALSKQDGGTVVVSNHYVRIISIKGEWTIPYSSISSVDYVGHPSLHVQTEGRTYYIKVAGTHFNEEERLSEASTYIRRKQRGAGNQSTQNISDDDTKPLDQIKQLGELRDAGAISKEEFEEKKQELLDRI
jgi:hypothetical protein